MPDRESFAYTFENLTNVVEALVEDPYRIVVLGDGTELNCQALLVATGVSYRRLKVPGLERLTGAGVYYGGALSEALACADADVYIIGGANSAGQSAVHFAKHAHCVTMLVRSGGLAATMSRYLIEQIEAMPNIRVWTHSQVVEARGDDHLEAIVVANSRDGEQLRWIAEQGNLVETHAGEVVFAEGVPSEAFYIPLQGAMRLSKLIGGHETVIVTTEQVGVWAGSLPVFGELNAMALRTQRASRLLRLPTTATAHMLRAGFPIAHHLLAGVLAGGQNLTTRVRQQEKLSALGKLAAGLAHALNNPASAAGKTARWAGG